MTDGAQLNYALFVDKIKKKYYNNKALKKRTFHHLGVKLNSLNFNTEIKEEKNGQFLQ